MMGNRKEGGLHEQLLVCGEAPPADFRNVNSLEEECAFYTWRQIFTGGFKYFSDISVPLQCAASQASIVFRFGSLLSVVHTKLVDSGWKTPFS